MRLGDAHYRYARCVALSVLGGSGVPSADADDIAAEAARQAVEALARHDPARASAATYLYAVAARAARRGIWAWRARRAREDIDAEAEALRPSEGAGGGIPQALAERLGGEPLLMAIARARLAGETWQAIMARLGIARRRMEAERRRLRRALGG